MNKIRYIIFIVLLIGVAGLFYFNSNSNKDRDSQQAVFQTDIPIDTDIVIPEQNKSLEEKVAENPYNPANYGQDMSRILSGLHAELITMRPWQGEEKTGAEAIIQKSLDEVLMFKVYESDKLVHMDVILSLNALQRALQEDNTQAIETQLVTLEALKNSF